MRTARGARAAFWTLALAAVAASISLAQGGPHTAAPPGAHVPPPMPQRTLMPLGPQGFGTPTPSPSPGGAPATLPQTPSFKPGRSVPLGALPPLPRKTSANTAYFVAGGHGRRMHPMAANGATIGYFADSFGNTACASAVGTLIPVNCDVFWQEANNPSGTYQDVYVPANSFTATLVGSTYSTNNGSLHDTPDLTPTGTYVLAVLNTTANKWESVVYVSVGSVNVFGTYADSAATILQQQFTASNSTNVYINASGLTQGDYYVVAIESTSPYATCTYVAPPPSSGATPNPNATCDPSTSAGIRAVVGASSSAAITAVWPLSSTTPTGTYSVVLYDQTTSTRLAMRQISITGSSATGAIALTPVNGNSSLGTNWPTPPPSPYSATTKFAFDSTSDEADKGWTLAASGLAASKSYTFTVSDPTGGVVSGPTTYTSTSTKTLSASYTFGSAQSPINYIGNTYTVQLYNKSTGSVDASQAFQILGYHATTMFTSPSGTSEVLPQNSSVTTGLEFTNDGDTYYGSGNGDTIKGITFNTGTVGIYITMMDTSVTSCGMNCQQEIVADSNGQNWTVQTNCYGGGANKGCTITAYPVTSGNTLAMTGYLLVPDLQFTNVPGNSNCGSGCTAYTSILPTDGVTWGSTTASTSSNPVYFTNGSGNSYSGVASVRHLGYRDTSNNYYSGYETHNYAPNAPNAIYTSTSPFAPTAGYSDVFSLAFTNNSSLGTSNISEIEIQVPTAYSPGGTSTTAVVDASSPTSWTRVNCPTGAPSTAFCLQTGSGNGGITPSGNTSCTSTTCTANTQTIYLDINPPPPSAFSYTDLTLQAVLPTPYTFTPDSSQAFTAFVGSATSLDATAIAAYSLNSTLITPSFLPTSEGTGTDNTVTINVTNASTVQDPNPDYLDAITIDIPSTNTFKSLTGMPAGWSLIGSQTVGSNTRYWFGLCAGQYVTADGPGSQPPPAGTTLPNCGAAAEANAIAPGKTFTVTGNLLTASSNISAVMYAHGANVAGWSSSHTFTLTVTATSAAAGFSAANGYPTATTVSSPNTPQVGGDSDLTYGNAYTYVIQNTSGSQNITSAKIRIPGKDTNTITPNDGTGPGGTATPWTLTGAPTISGSSYNCSITSYSSAQTSGADGAINIGGSSCSIPPGSSITVKFTAKAPYTVNLTYSFDATVNGSVSAAEMWPTDTIVQIILAASISISVNPTSPGPGGSRPSVNCAACSFNTTSNEVDYENAIPNLSAVTEGDVARVSVTTDAGSTVGWKLYVSADNNPANTGSPTNELLTSVDKTASLGGNTITGLNFDTTTYTVIPTPQGATSLYMVDTGSGASARRAPYDFIMNYEISIQGGSTAPQTANLVYTFISN